MRKAYATPMRSVAVEEVMIKADTSVALALVVKADDSATHQIEIVLTKESANSLLTQLQQILGK